MNVRMKKGKVIPVMHMVTPGRRALGEGWSKVTVSANPDTGQYETVREDTEAPADNTAIVVPAMGNISIELADYILEYKKKDQEYRKTNKMPIKRGYTQKEITQMFYEYLEAKRKKFKNQTQSGPGGWTQRSR